MTARYRVEALLGRGSYGAVYRATLLGEDGFEKPVAIKLVESDIDDAQERLIDEARILGRLRHRAIPAVDGLVRLDGGARALVLEYVDGADLTQVLRHAGPFPVGPLARLGAEIASALAFAWDAEGPTGPLRMVHRDIKTSNVMLTRAGDVKLLDFGIARARIDRAARTQLGMIVGTLRYMSPEAFEGRPGHPADVFALAITLLKLRMAANKKPLGMQRGDGYLAARDRLVDSAQLPRAFRELLATMLHPDPAQRPAASEVAAALEAIVDDLGGVGLRTWAREAWGQFPAPGDPPSDPTIGRFLTEVEVTGAPLPSTGSGTGKALLGLGAGLSVSLVSLVGVAGVALALVAGILAWRWWTAPLADVRLTPRAATSDANPEHGLAIDADGHLFYVDEGQVMRDGESLSLRADFISVSADGQRLAAELDGTVVVWDGQGRQRTVVGPGLVPQLSPDGSRLAYLSEHGLMLRELRTGEERRVAEGSHGRWSPDGSVLAIPAPDGLVLLDVVTDERTRVDTRPVDVALTRRRIWMRSIHGPVDDLTWVPRARPTAEPVHALTTLSRLEELVAAPDGPLAWTQSTLAYDLMVHPIDDGQLGAGVRVPVAGRWVGRGLQVDDEGHLISSTWVPGEGTGTVQIERLDAAGGREKLAPVAAESGLQVLADGRVVFWDISATTDGFLRGQSAFGGMHLVAVNTDGTASTLAPLADDEVADWALDPAGTTLAVLTTQHDVRITPVGTAPKDSAERVPDVQALYGFSRGGALAVRTAEGLAVWEAAALRTVLATDVGRVVDAEWLDESHLLAHTEQSLVQVNVLDGRHQTLRDAPTAPRQRADIAVSPNGRWVLVDHTQVHGDVWIADIAEP